MMLHLIFLRYLHPQHLRNFEQWQILTLRFLLLSAAQRFPLLHFSLGEALSLLSRSKNHPALTLIRDRSALKDRPIPYDFYHLYAFSYFFIKIEALWPPNPSELLIA